MMKWTINGGEHIYSNKWQWGTWATFLSLSVWRYALKRFWKLIRQDRWRRGHKYGSTHFSWRDAQLFQHLHYWISFTKIIRWTWHISAKRGWKIHSLMVLVQAKLRSPAQQMRVRLWRNYNNPLCCRSSKLPELWL